MRDVVSFDNPGFEFASGDPVTVESVSLVLVRLPLREVFETSFGSIDSRLIFLVSIQANGFEGWGEVVAAEEPLYSYETIGTAAHVIRDYLAQTLMSGPLSSLAELALRFRRFKGHNMAKAGLELAFMDLLARTQNKS